MYKTSALCLSLCLLMGSSIANPMRPDPVSSPAPVQKVTQPKKVSVPRVPTLNAIVIVGDLRKAVFNGGTEVLLGEKISSYQLVAVTAEYVDLKYGTTTQRIRLKTAGAISITPTQED